ncbi:MAG TPA: exosortase/archaeosortase family protein [Humisphaera sp.]|nr:exosortase/archaeosortase family protein [Humisphaera sp.]
MSVIDQLPSSPATQPAPTIALRPVHRRNWFLPHRTDRWTLWHAGAAAVMAFIGVLATWGQWTDIYDCARSDEEYSHIFLVPIVVACMVWVRRHRFRYCKPSGTALGFVIVAAGWAVTMIGYYGIPKPLMVLCPNFLINFMAAIGIDFGSPLQSLWHGGAVLVVIGCATAILGKHMIFRFLPAVAVLIFLIPVPGLIRQKIAMPLEMWTAHISQLAFGLIGVAVERRGNLLSLNHHPVNIAEACNGLRMVFALVLIGYAFSFGLPLRNSVRFIILAASPLATIFCNVVRILPTIWIYGYYEPRIGEIFHNYSGWLMLPISFLMLLGLIKVLRWAMIPVMRYTLAS